MFKNYLNGKQKMGHISTATVLRNRMKLPTITDFYGNLQTKQETDYAKSALFGIQSAVSMHITGPSNNRKMNKITDNLLFNQIT